MPSPRRNFALPEYQFDPRLGAGGRYINAANGRIVSRDEVNAAMEARIRAGERRMEQMGRALANGEISLPQWQVAMRDEIKLLHTMAGAVAKGGWDRMSRNDWLAIARASKSQYRKLQGFAQDIYSGKQKLLNLIGQPNGRFLQRAKMYANAAHGTKEEMGRKVATERGMVEEKRVREARHSCNDCIRYAALDWQPIGTLPAPGQGSVCMTNCRCSLIYRDVQGNVYDD